MAEDEMVGWHHPFDGLEFEQAPGVNDGQGTWRAAVHGVSKNQTRLSEQMALMGPFSSQTDMTLIVNIILYSQCQIFLFRKTNDT